MLAVFLRVGLSVPFMTTFLAIGVIYLMHVVAAELGTGVTTAWRGARLAGNMAIAIVIFLALRFIAGDVVGLYPIDTYGVINNSGGLYGILPSRDISKVILWEVLFAFVAGCMAVSWARGTNRGIVGTIFAISLAILTLQIAFPTYTSTFPSRRSVDQKLATRGFWGVVWDARPWYPTSSSTTAPITPTPTLQAPVNDEPVLVPRYECDTDMPCSTTISWPFRISKSGGKSLTVTVNDGPPVTYGPGNFSPPEVFGKYEFSTPKDQPVHVWVEERRGNWPK